MATEAEGDNYLELFDVANKEQVGKVPLASIRFIPRAGERIFLHSSIQGKWVSYRVIEVEYFLGYDLTTGQPTSASAGPRGRITLYVEPHRT
jgi:hypothetical protein